MTTSSVHPRRALAEAEAAAWLDLHNDWAKGLGDPDRRCLNGERLQTMTSYAVRAAEADNADRLDATTWRERPESEWTGGALRAETTSATALGFTPWAAGWETKLREAAPSPDSSTSSARAAWREDHAPRLVGAIPCLDADGVVRHGDWVPAPLSPAQLCQRQGQSAWLLDEPIRRITWVCPPLRREIAEPRPAWVGRLLAQPRRVMPEVTWTLSESYSAPLSKLLRATLVRRHVSRAPLQAQLRAEYSLSGDASWPSFYGDLTRGALPRAGSEPSHYSAAVDDQVWRADLAAQELDAWCRARLTARQYQCLVTEDLSDPAVRRARFRAQETLRAELPVHLRGLRRVLA